MATSVMLSPDVLPSWVWVACALALASIPASEWLRRDPQRVRFTVAFALAVVIGAVGVFAASPPPGIWDACCQWLIPYGVCWPIEWC